MDNIFCANQRIQAALSLKQPNPSPKMSSCKSFVIFNNYTTVSGEQIPSENRPPISISDRKLKFERPTVLVNM